MKKIILMCLIVLLAIGFTGCTYGSTFTIGSFENNTLTSMSMKYNKFSGNKNKSITVKDGETCEVYVDIKTEEGKIDLLIKDESGNLAYEGHDIQTSNFTVNLKESGKYKIRIEAKKHKGSYSVKWDVKSNN